MTATNFEINSGGGAGSGAASGGSNHGGANTSTMAHYNSPGGGGGGASVAATGNVASAASQAADSGAGGTTISNAAALLIQPNSPSSSSSTSKNNGDSTFEPTVDMMVNDFDDEQTLEEEEALAAREAEDPSAELSNLQKESDMPIEELLALYNCAGPATMGSTFTTTNTSTATAIGKRGVSAAAGTQRGGNAAPVSSQILAGTLAIAASKSRRIASTSSSRDGATGGASSTRENGLTDELDEDDFDEDDDDEDEIKETSKLRKLYPETYGGNEKRLLRTISRQQSDEEDDGDYSPDEDEFKKTIMVGSEFQAVIPEGFFKYDDVLPYENEDKLLWDPSRIGETSTEEYLFNVLQAKQQQQQQQNGTNGATSLSNQFAGVDSIRVGSHLRDDEQALYLLLQCGHNTDEALRRKRINSVPSSEQMSSWSEDECRNFESGIRIYGKDFHTIQQTKVHTRSVGELVQFYYLWKKTERHDIFANKARLEKKKYSLHPGLTDYMDRFLEEQDGGGGGNGNSSTIGGQASAAAGSSSSGSSMTLRDRSLSPGLHSITSSAQHNRKHLSSSTSLPATTLSQEANKTKSDCKSTSSSTKSKERHVDDEENDADDDENYDEDSDNRDRARNKNSQADIGAGRGGAGVISDSAESATRAAT